MSTDIEIDDDVFAKLQAEAVPLVDSPNDVLRRLLGLDKPRTGRQSGDPAQDASAGSLPLDAGEHGSGTRSTLIPPPPPSRRRPRSSNSRRAAGELLPLEEYCRPILATLIENGGELRSREVPEAMEHLIDAYLHPADRVVDNDGVPVWFGRLGWAASMCRKEGHLDSAAPRGIWRITDEGRKAAAQEEGD